MIAIPYDPLLHLETINAWCRGWNMQAFPEGWLPATGVVIPATIAAFCYMTDSKVAFIENVISNPDSDPAIRKAALPIVAQALEDIAKRNGALYLIGSTSNRSVATISKANGWNVGEAITMQMTKTIGLK